MTSDVDAVVGEGVHPWPSERPRTATALAALIRSRIALGGLPPGSKLPTERELATALGVGRNTVREAIRHLAHDGLVSTTLGRSGGTWVEQPPPEEASRHEIAASFRRIVDEYMEYRAAIEPLAARLAAVNAAPEDVRALGGLLDEPAADLSSYHQLDSRLHLVIARSGGNTVVSEAVGRAREEMFVRGNVLWVQSTWSSVYSGHDGARDAFRQDHADLVRAITARDEAAAEAAMTLHLAESRRQFLTVLDTLTAPG